jgi:ATP-dependent Lhr-like helicase
MAASPIVLRQVHKPTPFAFPIMVSRFREKLSSEKLADRVARMQLEFDRASLVAPDARSSSLPRPSGSRGSGAQLNLLDD